MNELIKKHARIAGFDEDVHGSNDGNFYGWDGRWINDDITKLSTSIINECIDSLNVDIYGDTDYARAYRDALTEAGNLIRKRFHMKG